MGIRFRCHHCESELHVKDFQAGRRGRCPECGGPFRIPLEDAPHSLDPQLKLPEPGASISQAKPDLTAPEKAAEAQAETRAEAVGAADAASQTAGSATATSRKATAASGSAKAAGDNAGSATAASNSAAPADSPSAESAAPDLPPPPPPPAPAPPQPALPRALQVAVDGKWYVRPPSGGQYGPAASTTMWQWLTENRVGRDALVWTEGWPEWVIAETAFDDFFTAAPSLPADVPPAPVSGTGKLTEHTSAPSQTAAAAVAPAEPLLSDRNRAERKQKRRRNYTLMIVGLSVIMLILIATLIFVLGSQSS